MLRTKRLKIVKATSYDIKSIMEIENHSENRNFVWQGTYEQHLSEIEDPNHLLLIFKEIKSNSIIGFSLIYLDFKSNLFELRRIAVTKKGIGYGKESMIELIKYAFEKTDTNRFWLDVYPDNHVGIKLYESLGMKRDGILRQNYKSERGYLDQIVYSILRHEYEQIKDKLHNT